MLKARFASQLFIFSDKYIENIDSLFSGSVIVEYDLHTDNLHAEFDDELILMSVLARNLINDYQKMTLVINYSHQGLLLAKQAGGNEIFKLRENKDYEILVNLYNAVISYYNTYESIPNARFFAESTLNNVTKLNSKNPFTQITKLASYLTEINDQHEAVIDAFKIDFMNKLSA